MTNRKVAIVGRSLRKNVNISRNLGYLEVPEDMIVKPAELSEFPRDQQMILCTGSQGEPMSALTRIAYRDHQTIEIERGDTVILSAKPVPGNELRVHDAINRLTRLGAEVLHQEIAPVHVSGHGCAEELRTILSLVRPKAVMPVHGEFRMLDTHARLARDAGVPADSIVMAENGSVVELARAAPSIVGEVESGVTLVDGLSVGDIRDVALRDRRHLSEHGVLIVVATLDLDERPPFATPELIGRGMSRRAGELLAEAKDEAERVLQECLAADVTEIKLLQEHLHDAIGQLIYDRTAPADDPARRHRGVSACPFGAGSRAGRTSSRSTPRAARPVRASSRSSGACEAAALAFCRLLERWARGDAVPSTPGGREAALRHAADRAETAWRGSRSRSAGISSSSRATAPRAVPGTAGRERGS